MVLWHSLLPDFLLFPFSGNHKNIFNDAGVPWAEYRYFDPSTVGLDFEGMMADIEVRIKTSDWGWVHTANLMIFIIHRNGWLLCRLYPAEIFWKFLLFMILFCIRSLNSFYPKKNHRCGVAELLGCTQWFYHLVARMRTQPYWNWPNTRAMGEDRWPHAGKEPHAILWCGLPGWIFNSIFGKSGIAWWCLHWV